MVALLALLGPVKYCSAMASRASKNRLITSEPLRGTTINVAVDTHVTGTLEFASGAMALHSLELMEGLLWSAGARQFCELITTFNRPRPLAVDFPDSER
jgi:hypothetical protein